MHYKRQAHIMQFCCNFGPNAPTLVGQAGRRSAVPSPVSCESCHVTRILPQVVEGLDIVKKIENTKTARGDAPVEKVVISDAGEA